MDVRNFPKGFPSGAQLCKGTFPSGNYENFLAAALVPYPVIDAELSPLANPSCIARPSIETCCALEVIAKSFGSCRFGHCTFGSFYLENCHLERRPWENAFGKIPNTSSSEPLC